MKLLKELSNLREADQEEMENKPDEKVENTLIAKAGDFRVEVDADEKVFVTNTAGKILLSMPLVIWKQLVR